MTSPEAIFARQCRQATDVNGVMDLTLLAETVTAYYRRLEQQILLAEETIDVMNQRGKALSEELMAAAEITAKRNALFRATLQNIPLGISMFDEKGELIIYNQQFHTILGIPVVSIKPGTQFADLRTYIAGTERPLARELDAANRQNGNETEFNQWKMDDGRIVEATITRLADSRVVALHRDVTAEHRAAEHIHYIAHHDTLTHLPNRLDFTEKVEGWLKQTEGQQGKGALLLVNLDFFKGINDTLGVAIGDLVLEQAGARVAAIAGTDDFVARLGSDEFAIFQTSEEELLSSDHLGQAIINQLSHPFNVFEKQVMLSASVGIATTQGGGENVDQLLKNAGLALARAKTGGRKTLRYFNLDMDAQTQDRRALEADLRKAVHNAEFEVYYQPIYDLKYKRIVTQEALIRWVHPERGLVSPGDFIPLAEEMGLIIDIGRWVLYQACLDALQWPSNMKVSVNISPIQFDSPTLLDDILSALAVSGLPPERLDLEITESVLLKRRDETLSLLHDLKFHGISISMDDFGTGYSSLSYLRSFPFDKIKIDKSFVDDIVDNTQALALIRAIIFLAKSLGMGVTVEGVETEEQFRMLRQEDCDEIQGYFVHRPTPARSAPMVFAEPM